MNEDEAQAYLGHEVDLLDAVAMVDHLRALHERVPARTLMVHTGRWALAYGRDAARWREPLAAGVRMAGARYALGDGFTRILGRDLALLLPTSRVAVFPQAFTRIPEYTVSVEVAQLDGALHQDCTLLARWVVAGKAGTDLHVGTFTRSAPAGENYATFVAAVSRLIGELAQEIAAGVRGLPQ